MAINNYLGNVSSPSGASLIVGAIKNAMDKQRQEKMAMAQKLIDSGAYSPVQGGQQPGLLGRIGQGLAGPQVGGPNMNIGGQNYQFQTPQMQAQAQANALKLQMQALGTGGGTAPTDTESTGTDDGTGKAPSQFVQEPSVKVGAGGKPELSLSSKANPDYKTYQQQAEIQQQARKILKSKPGDSDYEFDKDLAYGRVTIPFFESMLRGFSGNSMAIRMAHYANAKKINPSFNESLFEMGMFGPKAGIQSLGRYNAMQGMLAKNVDNQLDVAIGLSGKINRSSFPILNKADYLFNTDLNQVPGLSGDIKNFINSCKLAAIDAARVETGQTTGAALTDSARENFKTYLSATDSPDTFMKTANFAKLSTRNKIEAGADEMQHQVDLVNQMQDDLQGGDVSGTGGNKPLGSEDIDKMSPPQYTEGQTATNPQTKQKMVFKGGQWQMAQ